MLNIFKNIHIFFKYTNIYILVIFDKYFQYHTISFRLDSWHGHYRLSRISTLVVICFFLAFFCDSACTEKTIFLFPFKLNGIWSWWQFSFQFWTKWTSIWFKIKRKTVTTIISHSMWKEMEKKILSVAYGIDMSKWLCGNLLSPGYKI